MVHLGGSRQPTQPRRHFSTVFVGSPKPFEFSEELLRIRLSTIRRELLRTTTQQSVWRCCRASRKRKKRVFTQSPNSSVCASQLCARELVGFSAEFSSLRTSANRHCRF